MYRGLTDYDEPFPCPNGLGIDDRKPGEVPAWRARIEKAKRDIEAFENDMRVLFLAKSISVEQVKKDVEEIRAWVKSLQRS